MAAQWTGAYTHLPTWAPNGVVLSRWAIVTDAGAGNDRLVVRFRRGAARLEWEVSDSREIDRERTRIDCGRNRRVAGVIGGRAVHYRKARGVETAWTCISVGFPLTISISQPAGSSGGLRPRELQRMVAGSRPQPPGRTHGSSYELPSANEVDRIAASYARAFFLPRELPGGFILSQWDVVPRDYNVGNRRSLHVTFGRDGRVLQWGVYSGIDSFGSSCPARKSPFSRPNPVVINGRRVFFVVGLQGASAWTCVPARAVGNVKPLEVALWYDIRLDSGPMRREAKRIVATAEVVRP